MYLLLCLVTHLLNYPTGIKPNALLQQYAEKFGKPVAYHSPKGSKSLEQFLKTFLRKSVGLVPTGINWMKQKPNKDGTDKLIFKPYEVIVRKKEHKSMDLLHAAIQSTKRTTLRLLALLDMFKYSIYRKDIPGIFEQVYNQKLDDEDGILEIKLDCLLDSLEPFFRHKRSPFDGRMYFEISFPQLFYTAFIKK